MEKLRLDKIISATGLATRREVKLLVKQGRILADGVPVVSADEKFDPTVTAILLDGAPIGYETYTYLLLNKPAGLLSATEDRVDKTVLSLLPQELQRRDLFPVGRLDKDSEGLLLLTNDGALAHELLSPKYHVDKVYYVKTEGRLDEADCRAFEEGMTLGDGLHCLPAQLEILTAGEQSEAHVTLREGKFHQVKRMLAARGKPVSYLCRVQMGNLTLDPQLSCGAYRFLTENEIKGLSKKQN